LEHDLGVLRLSEAVTMPAYGQLPTQGLLDELYAADKHQFGTSTTCSGTSGAYRIDQPDDLAFLATFGVTP
jgi:hypothetical protein